MIGISTQTQNANGAIIFEENKSASNIRDGRARVMKRKTLDGNVVLTHGGTVHGDRDFEIRATLKSETIAEALWSIFEDETLVWFSCKEGVFSGAIERLKIDRGELRMSFVVKERLTS